MVGRLARYLRFVGCDTVYVRGLTDEAILELARTDDRVILTRDRALAARASRALLLESPSLSEQWRTVRAGYPDVPTEVRFERCTLCNGKLAPAPKLPVGEQPAGIPWDRVERGLPLFRCGTCGHYYWEGSHVSEVRARIASWSSGVRP